MQTIPLWTILNLWLKGNWVTYTTQADYTFINNLEPLIERYNELLPFSTPLIDAIYKHLLKSFKDLKLTMAKIIIWQWQDNKFKSDLNLINSKILNLTISKILDHLTMTKVLNLTMTKILKSTMTKFLNLTMTKLFENLTMTIDQDFRYGPRPTVIIL